MISIGSRRIGPGAPSFLVAALGSNHDRDLDVARRLIDASAEAGWDAVKLQLFRAEWLYPASCGVVETPAGNVDFFEVLRKAELPPEWLDALRTHARDRGLAFLVSPFDEDAVATLARSGVDALKIASPELNHLPLLAAAARTGLPLVVSTGLATLGDIEEALRTIRAAQPSAAVALLQCVTAYPVPLEESNLAVIATLAQAFGVPVGISDHTLDPEIAPAIAVAAGASLIEKHVTLGRDRKGPDHAFAIEPPEMKRAARRIRALDALPAAERIAHVEKAFGVPAVRAALGHGRKEIMPSEAPLYPCDKRSIHALRDLAPGDVLSPENIRILRSERNLTPGLHPRFFADIVGATVKQRVAAGEGVLWKHLLQR